MTPPKRSDSHSFPTQSISHSCPPCNSDRVSLPAQKLRCAPPFRKSNKDLAGVEVSATVFSPLARIVLVGGKRPEQGPRWRDPRPQQQNNTIPCSAGWFDGRFARTSNQRKTVLSIGVK